MLERSSIILQFKGDSISRGLVLQTMRPSLPAWAQRVCADSPRLFSCTTCVSRFASTNLLYIQWVKLRSGVHTTPVSPSEELGLSCARDYYWEAPFLGLFLIVDWLEDSILGLA